MLCCCHQHCSNCIGFYKQNWTMNKIMNKSFMNKIHNIVLYTCSSSLHVFKSTEGIWAGVVEANLCRESSVTKCICVCFLFSVTLHDSMSRAVCISDTHTLPQKTKCHPPPPPPLVLCVAHANQSGYSCGGLLESAAPYSFDRRTDGGCCSKSF